MACPNGFLAAGRLLRDMAGLPDQGTEPEPGKPSNDPRAEAILDAAREVHSCLGPGYLEPVYHEALEMELASRGIPFSSGVEVPVFYRGERLPVAHRAGLVCHGDLLVEVKAQPSVSPAEAAQVGSYLRACRFPVGLLLNFGESTLRVKRYVGPEHFRPGPAP
jgi:GxxExxY protein